MYVSRLLVRDLRNFRLLDVPLGPGATCIVGENNTGKTNLVHAIRLVLDANMSSFYRKLTPDDFSSGVDYRSPSQVLVSVEFQDFADKANEEATVSDWVVENDMARLTYRFRPRRPIRQEIEAGNRAADNLIIDDYHWEICGGGVKDPQSVTWDEDYGVSVRFEELQQSFLVILMKPLRDVEQELRHSRASPLGRLLDATNIPIDEQGQLIQILKNANGEISQNNTIHALGEEISGAFDETAGDAFTMGVKVGMASPSFADIARSLAVLLSNDAMTDFDPGRNGLGLNNILYISMLLRVFERRMAEEQTAGQLLLVEEPEAHLHPQLQRVLYNTLSKKKFQTIATTHSTHITSQVPLESIVILTNDGSNATASAVPNPNGSLSKPEVADLERYLDATRATLLYARKVILVEGPAELFLIPPLVRQVMNVSLDELGITVVPIFGIHFDVYAKLFGPNTITKKCAIIADGDLSPSDAEETDDTEEEVEVPKPDLDSLQNEFVKVFRCKTTFERAVTSSSTLRMFAATASELGAKSVAKKLLTVERKIKEKPFNDTIKQQLNEARDIVLRTAKRFGKARFAQVASRHTTDVSTIPNYIKAAINWLRKQ